ncbi:MAG: AbrB/MazE/SpoVT family DNA-binding domain-containing protein [Cyanobium sp.]
MDVITVSPKFQVVIPREIRNHMGLKAGQKLQVVPLPGRIELVPIALPGALRGFVAGPNSFERAADRDLISTHPPAALDG